MHLALDRRTVLVFDLDDTLVDERDYVHSGLLAVSRLVKSLYGADVAESLIDSFDSGMADPLKELCEALGLPPSVKPQLLSEYRNHAPSLTLKPGAALLLQDARAVQARLAVITDGRSVTQRQKLGALDLLDALDYVGISEEIGIGKPNPAAFRAVMDLLPGRRYVYVGDNAEKDFIAPNALGWVTIGVRNSRGIHRNAPPSAAAEPRHWVNDLADLVPRQPHTSRGQYVPR